jgi:hypothetical protein
MNPTPQERKKMITHLKFHMYSFALLAVALATLGFVLAAQPANAAPQQTIVGGVLLGNTTWTLGGSPYLVDSYIDVPVGVTLTIEAGVVVGNYDGDGSQSYNFDVEGTLVVGGGSLLPVHFLPGLTGWSGINITGRRCQRPGCCQYLRLQLHRQRRLRGLFPGWLGQPCAVEPDCQRERHIASLRR